MVRGTKSTTAFVEFVDVTSAMMVHDTLQVGWCVNCLACLQLYNCDSCCCLAWRGHVWHGLDHCSASSVARLALCCIFVNSKPPDLVVSCFAQPSNPTCTLVNSVVVTHRSCMVPVLLLSCSCPVAL